MEEYNNLNELIQSFVKSGSFSFPDSMVVNEIQYRMDKSSDFSIQEMIKDGRKGMLIYTTTDDDVPNAKAKGLDQNIVFLWTFVPGKTVIFPYAVRVTTTARLVNLYRESVEMNGKISIDKERIVGDVVNVAIVNIPGSKVLNGKIDTGADVSSLHAQEWKVDNGKVTFYCPELSDNEITLNVLEKQAIKTSNGQIEYRPVIELNIKINEQPINNVMFNLNDRGTMKYPMLIGQNALEAGKFLVDPSINIAENLNWIALDEYFKNDPGDLDLNVFERYNKFEEIIKKIKEEL